MPLMMLLWLMLLLLLLVLSIIKSAEFFLILIMIWTTLCGLKSTLMNMYLLRHWPLITNLRREYQENHSKSDIVEQGVNMKNNYVAQSATRYDFNILEAIKETLATMNIQ